MGHDDHDHDQKHDQVPKQHKARAPRSVKAYVITCSDSRTEETDDGGRIIREKLASQGHVQAGSAIVPDDPQRITAELARAQAAGAQVALVTGGTGLSRRASTFPGAPAPLARPPPPLAALFPPPPLSAIAIPAIA